MSVTVTTVAPRTIAAVRAHCALGQIAQSFRAPLDQVWAFLRARPALPRGHNIFLYHHSPNPERGLDVDFGVEVHAPFTPEGAVARAETPAGEVATAIHRGPYDRMRATHEAIHAWCAANRRTIGAASWEIYGDWTDDPAALETTIVYLLTA